MGAQVSNTSVSTSAVNKVIAEAMISTSQSCAASTVQSNTVQFGSVGGDFTIDGLAQDASSSVNFTCMQVSSTQALAQQAMQTQLTSLAASTNKDQTIGGQVANSKSVQNVIQDIASTTNISNIATCLVSASQENRLGAQSVTGDVNLKNISQKQAITLIGNCVQNNTTMQTQVQALATTLTNSATASNTGAIGPGVLIAIASIFAILLFLFLIIKFSSKGS